MLGGLIMAHGDDNGLRVPPRLAPIQAVVLLVRDEDGAGERAHLITESLRTAGVKVQLDDRTDTSFGRRVTDWELKGVPLRVEVGPRDLANEQATLVRRDTGEKAQVPLTGLSERGRRRPRAGPGATCWPRRPRSATPAPSTWPPSRRPARPARPGSPACPGALVGDAGEDGAGRSRRSPCAASSGPTARVPASEDEDDLVALVARSY